MKRNCFCKILNINIVRSGEYNMTGNTRCFKTKILLFAAKFALFHFCFAVLFSQTYNKLLFLILRNVLFRFHSAGPTKSCRGPAGCGLYSTACMMNSTTIKYLQFGESLLIRFKHAGEYEQLFVLYFHVFYKMIERKRHRFSAEKRIKVNWWSHVASG